MLKKALEWHEKELELRQQTLSDDMDVSIAPTLQVTPMLALNLSHFEPPPFALATYIDTHTHIPRHQHTNTPTHARTPTVGAWGCVDSP